MRTNIVIDDDLLERAMRATGAKTKREVVGIGLGLVDSIEGTGRDPRIARQASLDG